MQQRISHSIKETVQNYKQNTKHEVENKMQPSLWSRRITLILIPVFCILSILCHLKLFAITLHYVIYNIK